MTATARLRAPGVVASSRGSTGRPTCRSAPSAVACTRMATTLAVWYSAASLPTTTTRAGRIHDALGVDPIHFESGYPKLV
jgi:hypothetical protein